MKEGIRNFSVITAFRAPIPQLAIEAKIADRYTFKPRFINMILIIGHRAKTEPTDKSNSPEIINSVTPVTMIPSSGAIWRMSCMLARLRNGGESK